MTYGPLFPHAGAGFWLVAILNFAFFVLVIALIVLGIRWLIRGGASGSMPPPAGPRPDDPLEILRQRYARGEIDEEEFERRRKTLSGS